MKRLFGSITPIQKNFVIDERMIRIDIQGLPLCALGSAACKRVATMFSKFMFFEIDNAENFSTCRLCIATNQKKIISNEEVSVMINGETFEVHVRELSNWSVKIVDDIESEDERSEDENLDTQAESDTSVDHVIDTPNDSPDELEKNESPIIDNEDLKTKETQETFKTTNKEYQQGMKQQSDMEQCDCDISSSDGSYPPGFEPIKNNVSCQNRGTYFMVNVYDPHDTAAKVILWQKIISFIHQHNGRYVLFGDLNEVREESEWFGSTYSITEAQTFNTFIDNSGLKEMMMGGRFFTWMNKSGSKMSKLDRFLISEEAIDDNSDLKAMVLDRLWSDHSPILLYSQKTDYGSTPFKFFQSWFQRKDVDEEVISLIQDVEVKIDASLASDSEKETRLQLLRELNDIERDKIKKAVWDCGSDKAPSLDGFPFLFLKRYWEIFKQDVELFVSDFFTSFRMPPGTNSAFTTLLPKPLKTLAKKISSKVLRLVHQGCRQRHEKDHLGIGSLKAFNQALLQKWRWRLHSNPNQLWFHVIKSIYGEDAGFDHIPSTAKETWRNIIGYINHLHDCCIVPKDTLKHKVGCGTKVRFWIATWIGDDPLALRPIVSGRINAMWESLQGELQHVTRFEGQDEDRLPHRLNLSRRGLEIRSVSCPVYFNDWKSWFDNLHLSNDGKSRLQVIAATAWWTIWKYRNSVTFNS
nr:RNA-directed DNA polymerase, eukaryota, reverse transcriptase zinc-binding domain protein [Tanacetum cinerariifolium]